MAVETGPRPFAAPPYDVGPGLVLDTMTPAEATSAGTMCAAMDPWLSYPFPAGALAAFFAQSDPGSPRFALRHNGGLAGALVVRLNWLHGPYINMLMVAPSLQGRGLGSALLAWTEREARTNGARNLWIAATSTNAGAQALYARHGFAPVATFDALIRDGRDEILMRKKLVT